MPEPRVIVDAGPLVAFLVGDDSFHAWAEEQFGRLAPPFLTCEPVLTETFFLVHRLRGGGRRFFELLDSGLLSVDFDLIGERKSLAKLARKYERLPMSLADACLVRMAEIHAKFTVFTIDSHFRIYRKHGRQIIPVLLPPGR